MDLHKNIKYIEEAKKKCRQLDRRRKKLNTNILPTVGLIVRQMIGSMSENRVLMSSFAYYEA
jgi:hypothetical protein